MYEEVTGSPSGVPDLSVSLPFEVGVVNVDLLAIIRRDHIFAFRI